MDLTKSVISAGLLFCFSAHADFEIELTEALTNETGVTLNYDMTSIADGNTCIVVTKIERLRDNVNWDAPVWEPALIYKNYVDSNDSPDEDDIKSACRNNLDGGSEDFFSYAGISNIFTKRHRSVWNDNSRHSVIFNNASLAAAAWAATGKTSYDTFLTGTDAEDAFGEEITIDDTLKITTVVARRNNSSWKQFYYFDSYVNLDDGTVVNVPPGMDLENWVFPGYDAERQVLPALLTFEYENKVGCLAFHNGSNYECFWVAEDDKENVFPTSVDLSNPENLRVLMCGSDIDTDISLGEYAIVSVEDEYGWDEGGYDAGYRWCLRADKSYRTWHNMVGYVGQGWLAAKDGNDNWWCIRDSDNICLNGLVDTFSVPAHGDITAKHNGLAGKMADSDNMQCRFNDGSIADCPSAFENTVSLDTLQKSYYLDAAKLLDSEEPQ